MYSRFFRWATDRLGENGIIAFVTNSSFIDARTFDGFRKVVENEFSEIYIIDLGGNIRAGDKTGNVFNIMVGVAITFLIKKENTDKSPCKIFYYTLSSLDTANAKLGYISQTKIFDLSFQHIFPDDHYNWINLSQNNFDYLIPLVNKNAKLAKSDAKEMAVFNLFSLGIATNRDEWVYDFDDKNLEVKAKFFCDFFEEEKIRYNESSKDINITNFVNRQIKWTSELEKHLAGNSELKLNIELIREAIYRPYVKKKVYYDKIIIHRQYQIPKIFPDLDSCNQVIWIKTGFEIPFFCLAIDTIPDLLTQGGAQCLPLYRYDKEGNRIDNITDWGLQQFQKHYNDKTITKLDIFHYTYAVLHYPEYRSKYELNLKREFPRLPFYDNFSQWVEWGSKLMELHINYETVAPYPLTRIDTNNNLKPKTKLKADREKNSINLDDITFLQDIPKIAWEYKLGNRSALEWILDQYKEKKPKDKTIAERFNNYRFADYKETVIDLLQRVCTVSVETMKIIEAMRH